VKKLEKWLSETRSSKKLFRNKFNSRSKKVDEPNGDYSLNLLEPINFQLNKFFYKNIGKKHKWIDRLVWTEAQWIDYVSNKNVENICI
jgi:hypothetical protein